jgi:hypothetical protein
MGILSSCIRRSNEIFALDSLNDGENEVKSATSRPADDDGTIQCENGLTYSWRFVICQCPENRSIAVRSHPTLQRGTNFGRHLCVSNAYEIFQDLARALSRRPSEQLQSI